ncbi:protein SHI RELATED SEQUENCE 1-like [Ananas comosus]|uniref:Protein SHI RELATED SEQUENCE 1-like n=2 Tax=Ananas comosus TaxID=4615 RepID=A0A6P5ELW3_ANACO|nr:protein SHI RELATED SEQUENCE 1-like [Ananas comosus]XP_020096466.1 protein SHI RELATED SEQUENCE 1-like [Ananas comosus]XP_020096467.1 protein SHI RELATED SEQUENCE 1-like [Ananas comosus]CAD1840577.1 unnamed protein product [Ananas comosus var. bracteatus]
MAGFSLGGGRTGHNQNRDHNQQQQQQQQQQQHQQQHPININPTADSLFLYGYSSSSVGGGGGGGSGFQLWHQEGDFYSSRGGTGTGSGSGGGGGGAARIISFSDDHAAEGVGIMRGGSGGSSGGGGMSCRDCGNQAKKDCVHLRCRTCCKSRGFHCPTHVKSTWVPAARRRERQHNQQQQQQQQFAGGGSGRGEPSKRAREVGGPREEVARFPAEVSSEAVFRCVRVGPVEDEGRAVDEEYAYSTAVSIGGHVFKGILHHYGPDPNSSTSSDYHLLREGSPPTSAVGGDASGAAVMIDPYPTPLSGFLSGAQYYPHHTTSQ